MKKISIKSIFVIIVIIAVIFSITSLFIGFGNLKYLSPNYIAVSGTTTDVWKVKQAKRRVSSVYRTYLTIEFRTLNNEVISFTSLQQIRILGFPQRGQQITVVYNKNNPQEVAIKITNYQWGLLAIPFIFLVALLILYRRNTSLQFKQ